jgi:hypothetical protein
MSNTKQNTKVEVAPFDAAQFIKDSGGVSKAIRILAKDHTRGEIAKKLGKRYQHVRNVLTTELKKK